MDNTSLIRADGGFVLPERNSKIYLILMVLISSWTNSCIAMIWPLLVANSYLRFPFHATMFLIDVLLCFFLGMISDLKSRKVSVKHSLKIMLGSVLTILAIVAIVFFLKINVFESGIVRYSGKYGSLSDFNMEELYDNVLTFDKTRVMDDQREKVKTVKEYTGISVGNMELPDGNNSNISPKNNNIVIVFTLLLFTMCCILQSSSLSLYYNLNILIVDDCMENTTLRSYSSYRNFAGWSEMCFYNIGCYLCILITRLVFISALKCIVGDDISTARDAIEMRYIHIYCMNLLVLVFMIPLGYYLAEYKLVFHYTEDFNKAMNNTEYFQQIRDFVGGKNNIFWLFVIPYWIIYFIQSGNNFHNWILIDQTASNIQWWELYSLLCESVVSLIISIVLSFISNIFSPVILQLCCFAILSMVSFGLTLCTIKMHEIPVKTFMDFISAFTLCHGVFHVSCITPSLNALYFVIKFTPPYVKSTVLSIIHSIILTAPIADQIINDYSFKIISISGKFLIITAMTLIGIVFTGLFMAEQSTEEGHALSSFELLPVFCSYESGQFKY
ncbi:transmembrane domain-containing protein [Cryptosporidium canis]|uniref:Transmembrane domain-containing protein n=1 Tax=Cryptosporidium canis TaxID=195482 RepID=A0A9D5DN93_9CRYT|nr:transmembrane domain-containing protein [Cryptosporidium canis]